MQWSDSLFAHQNIQSSVDRHNRTGAESAMRVMVDQGYAFVDVPSVPVLITVLSERDDDKLYLRYLHYSHISRVVYEWPFAVFLSFTSKILHYLRSSLISKTDNRGHDKPVHLRVLVMASVVHAIYGVPTTES